MLMLMHVILSLQLWVLWTHVFSVPSHSSSEIIMLRGILVSDVSLLKNTMSEAVTIHTTMNKGKLYSSWIFVLC